VGLPAASRAVTIENWRTTTAAFAGLGFVKTPTIWLETLRRNRLRPCAPTYAAVSAIRLPRSCCTDAVYCQICSGIEYSFASARGWYDRLFGLLTKFATATA